MDLLEIYVEDHLALSLAGIKLARRCLKENRDTPLGPFLERLVTELEDDRAILEEAARALGAGASRVKELAASIGEWAGRLKPNGRVFGYSDLSRVWELEALMAGSESRRGLWKVLGTVRRSALDGFDFARLEERARGHRDQLDRQRVRAARGAFRPPARTSGTRAAAVPAR
jgi:hypothetical protein